MALYLNGNKLLNSLVIDGDMGGREVPYVVFSSCINKSSIRTITYTITEDSTFQVYVFWTNGSQAGEITDIDVRINNVPVTLNIELNPNDYKPFAYGELNLKTDDVITISNTVAESNRGLIAFLLKNADISNFEVVGNASNDDSTFPIGHQSCVLECYQYTFYNGKTTYNYMIVADVTDSIPTPSGTSSYFYGGTWAIRV